MILHWIQCMTAITCTTDVVVQLRYVHRRHQLPKIRRPNNWQCASETYTQRPNNWYQEPEIYTSDQKLALTRWADKSHTWPSIASNSYPLSALHFKLLTKETCQIHIHSDPITNNRSQKYIYISAQKLAFTRRADKSHTGYGMTSYCCELRAFHLKLLASK